MWWITQILNQLGDNQHRGPIHSPDELGVGAASVQPISYCPQTLEVCVYLFIMHIALTMLIGDTISKAIYKHAGLYV